MTAVPQSLVSVRLELIPATAAMLRADMLGGGSLATLLNAQVPADWPVEYWDHDAIRWLLSRLEAGTPAEWLARYVILSEKGGRQLVGTCGWKGPPDERGEVEVGYGVVLSRRRQGIAREAVNAMVEWAWADPRVRIVSGQTLADGVASQAVLRSCGFEFVGAGSDPVEQNVVKFCKRRAAGRP